jgi:hypothetical protein
MGFAVPSNTPQLLFPAFLNPANPMMHGIFFKVGSFLADQKFPF